MTDRIDEMNRDEEFEKWFAESVYSTELKMPLRRAWHAALKARPEAMAPVCWVIAVEEYGQMVVYGPQYIARRSAEQDAELPRKRGQKAEVWACYRPLPMNSGGNK